LFLSSEKIEAAAVILGLSARAKGRSRNGGYGRFSHPIKIVCDPLIHFPATPAKCERAGACLYATLRIGGVPYAGILDQFDLG
jgi:hypothetical protein